jgi:predicted nucleotide-binding protein
MAGGRKPEEPRSANLSAEQIRLGIQRIKRRIEEVEAFDPNTVNERFAPEVSALEAGIRETLSKVFGHNTVEYDLYRYATSLDQGPIDMGGCRTPASTFRSYLSEGRKNSLALLRQAVKGLEEELADRGDGPTPESAPEVDSAQSSDIFVVHGRDSNAKTEVARTIERAGLNAVILHELPNAGQTIIEKFERHAGLVGFAVIVLTPDDVGGPDASELHPRARQNVIGEMFWFAGKLGRNRVCALKKGDLEMPSDFAGVGYTEMDDRGAWKTELLKELKAAGYAVDWGKALA